MTQGHTWTYTKGSAWNFTSTASSWSFVSTSWA